MFCNKCGHKIIEGYNRCKNCGEPAANAEICGGFWGLVSEKNGAAPAPGNRPPMNTRTNPEGSNPKIDPMSGQAAPAETKKRGKLSIYLVALCALLVVGLGVQSLYTTRLRADANGSATRSLESGTRMVGSAVQASNVMAQEIAAINEAVSEQEAGTDEAPEQDGANTDPAAANGVVAPETVEMTPDNFGMLILITQNADTATPDKEEPNGTDPADRTEPTNGMAGTDGTDGAGNTGITDNENGTSDPGTTDSYNGTDISLDENING